MQLPGRRLPAREDQIRAPRGHLQGGFAAYAGVGAGDDDPFAGEVGGGDGDGGGVIVEGLLKDPPAGGLGNGEGAS